MFNPQLTVFVRVADLGSFNKAAESLFISPTAVMKQINTLERHLDLRLFERGRRGVTLTPEGQVIYRHARLMFAQSAKAVQEARAAADFAAPPFVWAPPSSIPASPSWTCGTSCPGSFPATGCTSFPLRTTTRASSTRSGPWG